MAADWGPNEHFLFTVRCFFFFFFSPVGVGAVFDEKKILSP